MGGEALGSIAARLLEEGTPVSAHVVDAPPTSTDAEFLELVREGYLLHYGRSRLLRDHDDDLALLAGDYLYALGIAQLAAAGDLVSIEVLAELIGDSAQLHAEGRAGEAPARWRRAVAAISGA
jgi:hypothetical protein